MKQRRLGKTGWDVSEIGLGCWQLGNSFGDVSDDAAQAILGEARMLGVNFWDTADVYGGGQSEAAGRGGAEAGAGHAGRDQGRARRRHVRDRLRQGAGQGEASRLRPSGSGSRPST